VIDNHFKSGPDTCMAHRSEQAKYNAALVAFIQAANPRARIMVGGDLNVYPRPDDPFAPIGQPTSSDQLSALYDPALGMTDLWNVLNSQDPGSAYSYVYVGMAQTLDQMFVNQALMGDLSQVHVAHINSDFAADYPGDVARGTSDHDPTVAMFSWSALPTLNTGSPYHANQASDIQLTATATDTTGSNPAYAWDMDNNGTFESSGQTVTFHAGVIPGKYTVAVRVTGSTGLVHIEKVDVFVNNRYVLPFVFRLIP